MQLKSKIAISSFASILFQGSTLGLDVITHLDDATHQKIPNPSTWQHKSAPNPKYKNLHFLATRLLKPNVDTKKQSPDAAGKTLHSPLTCNQHANQIRPLGEIISTKLYRKA